MTPTGRLQGFVLAGGRSSRFGSDKARAVHGEQPLLVHAIDALRALGIRPRVVTGDPLRYRSLATAFVIGERPGRGPVEGLRAALASTRAAWSLVLAADMPEVEPATLMVLVEEGDRPDPPPAACFADETGIHPLPGIYSRTILSALDALPPGASMHAMLERIGARILPSSRLPHGVDPRRVFRNVNRPEDLGNTGRRGRESD